MKLVNINKQYKKNVVFENLNIEFTTCGIYAITGLSGSGKTTLFNILYGIDNDYSGDYYIGNKLVKKTNLINEYNDNLSMVFQDTKLLDNLNVAENLELANKYDTNIDELLSEFNILNLKEEPIKYLSGGEKQRVAIIRAIMNNPRYILLDEPTSALDDNNTNFIISKLQELAKDTIIIVITHDERLSVHADYLYKLENKNIVKLDNNKITGKKVSLKQSKKNKNSLLKISFKNFKANKKSLLPTAMAILIATMFLTLICLNVVPKMITEVSNYLETGDTTTVYVNDNFEGTLDREPFTDEEVEGVTNAAGSDAQIIYQDITGMIGIYGDTGGYTVTESYLEYMEVEPSDPNYDVAMNEPLTMSTNVSSYNGTNNTYAVDPEQIIGDLPTSYNEVIVPTVLVEIICETKDYNSVIGEEITLDFYIMEALTDEEREQLAIEDAKNGTVTQNDQIDASHTFTITGVYDPLQDDHSKNTNFEANAEQAAKNDEYYDGFHLYNMNIYTYIPPFKELDSSEQQIVVDYINYTTIGEYEIEDFESGTMTFEITLPGNEEENATVINDITNSVNSEETTVSTSEYTRVNLMFNVGIFLLIFIFGAALISIILVCLNLMNLKTRRDEFAKYYLIGFKNSKIISSLTLELLYLNIIVVPVGIILALITYIKLNQDTFITNFAFIVVFVALLVFIMNLLVMLWYFWANRRKKILKNLREAK